MISLNHLIIHDYTWFSGRDGTIDVIFNGAVITANPGDFVIKTDEDGLVIVPPAAANAVYNIRD